MLLEKRYPHQKEAEKRSQLMSKVREILTAPSKEEAYTRFKALAQEDAPLARYLFPRDPVRRPQIKKGIEYLGSPEKGVPSTTSRMERAIREYRRRTRPMDGFKTDQGAENFSLGIL